MLAGALPQTIELLLVTMGEEGVRALLSRFAAEQKASLFGANEALAFADFLLMQEAACPPEMKTLLTLERNYISRLLTDGAVA
jgi:hypothetical protein